MFAAHTAVLKFSYILLYYAFYTATVAMEIQSETAEIVKRVSIVSWRDAVLEYGL